MNVLEIIKAVLFGIVEGITEWVPVSSTGHMILFDEFVKLNATDEFITMFLVVIQLGAIMAVVVLYWDKLFPFSFKEKPIIKEGVFLMWFKVIVAIFPSAIVGLLFDDKIDELFYNYIVVALALIIFGVLFIVVENRNKNQETRINSIDELTYKAVVIIGLFQLIAAVFPGTSRSGSTIIGAIIIGVSRTVAAEFTFLLAVPTMFGASVLKIAKHGIDFSGSEIAILLIGMVVAFLVSLVAIKFLMTYIKSHDFKIFGWYRIALGSIVLLYFLIT